MRTRQRTKKEDTSSNAIGVSNIQAITPDKIVGKNKIQKAKNSRQKKVSLSQNVLCNQKEDVLLTKKSHSHTVNKQASSSSKKENKEEIKISTIKPEDYGKPKGFTVHESKVATLTEWIDITVLELHSLIKKDRQSHKSCEDEEEICPICRCELYDDLFKLTKEQLDEIQKKQLEDPSTIEVVKFKDCLEHFYHKGCTEGMLAGKEYIKCAVCSKIYGELIGDSPPGKMSWIYYPVKECPLETYENLGTWAIHYSFMDGVRNGVPYRGTNRYAYLPDNKEGREVLILLIKAFQRKVTFTVGDSVTTGRKNVVVWNSVHHKTSTHGGTL